MPVLEEYSLTNKVAIVAWEGSSSYDFYTPYLAQALAEAGAKLVLVTNTQSALDSVAQALQHLGAEVLGTLCNTTQEEDVERVVEDAVARWGRVDILVSNFRTEFAKPMEGVTLDEFERVMEQNVRPVFLLCRSVGAKMVEHGAGRIVNITSTLAERGLWNSAVYCASQGAVLQFTRSLALEWGRYNVRVNAIGTGWFSPEEIPPEEAQKELLVRYIPLRRKGHPRDIGPLLVYLASDACDYTTGHVVYVDGGLMAHP